MSISELRRVLAPPSSPREVPPSPSWEQVEAQAGPLPDDYKSFIEEYGTGTIDDFIIVFSPFAASEYLNLMVQARRSEEALREGAEGADVPFDVERTRVFGRTDNGDFLTWQVKGGPAEWTVMVIDSRGPSYDHFEGGMTAFLAEALRGDLVSDVLPEDFPSEKPSFRPID